MLEAYMYTGRRSPFGRHAGALARLRPDDMLAGVIAQVVADSGFAPDKVEDVVVGCANQAGEDSRCVARHAALVAGLPIEIPGSVLQRNCGSGLNAIAMAAQAITCGEGEVFVAGGVESMSRAPFVMGKAEAPFSREARVFDSTIGARFPNPKVEGRFGADTMPETADNLARDYQITREAADTFAAVRKAGPVIYADYATTHDPIFILDGGRSTWALVSIPNPDYGPGLHVEGHVEPAIASAVPPGAHLTMTGFAKMLSNAGPNAGNLLKGMIFGAILAFATLLLVYGSPIAILPILMAIPAICVTFLCVLGLTYVARVSYFVEYMVVLLSLGMGIDFSLIVVVRWREERERGLSNEEAATPQREVQSLLGFTLSIIENEKSHPATDCPASVDCPGDSGIAICW